MASAYIELLKDPRWQKRRLEIFSRDGFACTECKCETRELHAHHRYYLRGRKPWEYDDDALTTLCERCHGFVTEASDLLKVVLGKLSPSQLLQVVGYAIDLEEAADLARIAARDGAKAAD